MSCQQATHPPDPPRRALVDRQDALGGYFAGRGADVPVKHVDRMHMPGIRVGVFLPHGCQRARTLRNLRKCHWEDDRTGVYAHIRTFLYPDNRVSAADLHGAGRRQELRRVRCCSGTR